MILGGNLCKIQPKVSKGIADPTQRIDGTVFCDRETSGREQRLEGLRQTLVGEANWGVGVLWPSPDPVPVMVGVVEERGRLVRIGWNVERLGMTAMKPSVPKQYRYG